MEEIKYMEKPEWVSWEDIADCLHKAHIANQNRGFVMPGLNISADIFRKQIRDGHCFVALDGDKVVGTNSVIYKKYKRKWWAKGVVAYNGFDAILPEYQGTDIYFGLRDIRRKHISDSGVEIICFNTSEHNKVIQRIALKSGAKYVQFARAKNSAYYSVIMAKWLHGCPYPDWFCNFMFKLSKIIVKTFWKPKKI